MILTWVKNLRIRQPLNVMTRLLAPRSTIALVLVLCIASVASQDPKFDFSSGIQFSPPCGLKAGVGTWTAIGTLTGDLQDYDKHVEVEVQGPSGRIGSPCSLDLTDCTSTPANKDFICYCTGSTGTGSSTQYSLNITAKARADQSEKEVVAEISHSTTADYEEGDIGTTPVMYEDVVPTIEIDDGPKQNLTIITNILIDTSSPTFKVKCCARHLNWLADGSYVQLNGGLPEKLECAQFDKLPSNTSAIIFSYTQITDDPCDKGKSFKINFAAPFTGSTTEKHGSTTDTHGSTTDTHGSTTDKHGSTNEKPGSTTEKQSNGCQQVNMNKLWIAALATSFIFLA